MMIFVKHDSLRDSQIGDNKNLAEKMAHTRCALEIVLLVLK